MASATELLAADTVEADLVLLDLDMPGPGPIETLRQLRRRQPALRILVLTMHKEPAIAMRLLRAGADGFVCKDNAFSTINLALRRTHAGGRFVDPDLVDGVLAILSGQADDSLQAQLSRREFEILQMMVAGRPLKAIAAALGISPKTVSTHKARLMDKLGVDSTAALVQLAMRRGVGPSLGHAGCAAGGDSDGPA
jgi:DNA-binding NarL/FixJ family response regulator